MERILAIFAVCLTSPVLVAAAPVVESTVKIWDKAPHNAFTDLARWHDRWWCTFREADAHVGGDGRIRMLVSKDGTVWESAAVIQETGIDLRDPKISVTPDNRLMLVMGGSVYDGTKVLKSRQPRVAFSKDGVAWSEPQRILNDGDWPWRVTWYNGKAYGTTYISSVRKKPAESWDLSLLVSNDGVKYETITQLKVSGQPNETTLRFLKDGSMMAMIRREQENKYGWLGISKPPFQDWTFTETKHRFGGPNFLTMPDDSMWAVNRAYGSKVNATELAKLTPTSYEPMLKFASGGDTSYAGLVVHDDRLWVSYYSSHEGKSAIYLAKVKLN